ncbi:hydantoinase/carbamoylase family amidase [Pseudochelatococcus sp. B33]
MGDFLVAGDLARRLFAELAQATGDAPGVTRAAYGSGEAFAHAVIRREAAALGAGLHTDAAGNLYATLAGENRNLPALFIGSHLDTVPHGGNYDGAAGVVAGLVTMAELAAHDQIPPRDLTMMVTRAEESAWFPLSYPGAQAALGKLTSQDLDTVRNDTGRSLADHIRDAGFDPGPLRAGVPQIDPSRIAAFLEVHIEQGPALVTMGQPLAIVSAISGGLRYPRARILGAYGHSGAEPRATRRDVVPGFADLVRGMDAIWDSHETAGDRLTLTFGRVESDPAQHGGSVVLGELGFCLDIRSDDVGVLASVDRELQALCRAIEQSRSLRIELGETMTWSPATMDTDLIARLAAAGESLDLRLPQLVSGGGHDTAAFVAAGIPSAMLFLRNENGSHNPDEAMDMDDFDLAVATLLALVREFPRDFRAPQAH